MWIATYIVHFRLTFMSQPIKVLIVLFLIQFTHSIKSQNVNWLNTIGGLGIGQNWDYGERVAHDNNGNIILASHIRSRSTINNQPYTLTPHRGGYDLHLSKYNPSGSLIWEFTLGGIGNDVIYNLCIDKQNNILCVIAISDSIDLDPGPNVDLRDPKNGSSAIVKYDPNGNFIWGKQSFAWNFSLTTDNNQNVYLTGNFKGTVHFNFDTTFAYVLSSDGGIDAFTAKYDSNLNLIWAKKFGGPGTDFAYSITVDEYHNVYTLGLFESFIDLDPDLTSVDRHNAIHRKKVFLSKLDSNGNFSFGKKFGATNYNEVYSIQYHQNHIYYNSKFRGSLKFNRLYFATGSGTQDHTYILKLDLQGLPKWVALNKSTGRTRNWGMSFLENGDVISGGYFTDTVSFYNYGIPIQLVNKLNSINFNAYIIVRDSTGTFKSLSQFGDSNYVAINHISAFGLNSIVATGYFEDTLNYRIGNTPFSHAAKGRADGFLFELANNITTDIKRFPPQVGKNEVYPNPFNDYLVIKTEESIHASLELYDLDGKLNLSRSNVFINSDYKLPVNLSSGTYFLKITNRESGLTTIAKLIKN